MRTKALKKAIPYTIPVLLGYIFMGIAFGILLSSKGYHFLWAMMMGIFIYAGSMQFVAIGIMTSPFHLVSALILTLTVNARHLFYGLSMITKFKSMGKLKPYMIFSLTDETYSLLCSAEAPKEVDANWFYFFISFLNQLYWVIGCSIGGILGSVFIFDTTGIDFAMTALFIVIFIEQWEKTKDHKPSLIGVVASIGALWFFGAENFIIPAMIIIFLALSIFKKNMEQEVCD